jgi:D-alanine-D-alanine ligase
LKGGLSAEREVSLRSGAAVAEALRGEGYTVTEIDVGRDLAEQLARVRPQACFNALHGKFGEDGCVQGVLELLEIPYTHSGVLASALAMHKERAKDIMKASGVPVAEARLVTRSEALKAHALPPPYVVKPVAEGSSVGVVIVMQGAERPPNSIADGASLDEIVMVERYVAGRELTCAVIGDFATDVIEIVPLKGLEFYDYEAKYAPGGSKHELPAQLLPEIYQSIRKLTLTAHQALGCRGVSRADFRLDDTPGGTGELICLEVNTQPGMTGTSLVPELAGHAGWDFGTLVRWIIEDASCNR